MEQLAAPSLSPVYDRPDKQCQITSEPGNKTERTTKRRRHVRIKKKNPTSKHRSPTLIKEKLYHLGVQTATHSICFSIENDVYRFERCCELPQDYLHARASVQEATSSDWRHHLYLRDSTEKSRWQQSRLHSVEYEVQLPVPSLSFKV